MTLRKTTTIAKVQALVLVVCVFSTLFSNACQPLLSRVSAMGVREESPGPTKLKIEAALGKKSFTLGERVQLVLWITNPGTEVVTVDDPRRGGDSLRLWLRLADGQERTFITGEALRAPGVKQILVGMRVPPGVRQHFVFDLAKLTNLNQAGSYTLRLEYIWTPGEQPWRSAEMHFSIRSP